MLNIDDRVERADCVLAGYQRQMTCTSASYGDDALITDLLADLYHWSQQYGENFDHLLQTALMHAEHEQAEAKA